MIRRLFINLLIKSKTYKFRQWIELEDKKIQIYRASEQDRDKYPILVVDFLSDALPIIPKWIWEHMYWVDVLDTFNRVCDLLPIRKYLPIVSLTSDTADPEKSTWDYPDRTWHYYSHLLAKSYGWSLEYIANLNVYDAMAKVEEIMVDNQFEREFQWSMSEVAFSYDTNSKTTKFVPLPRPYWMKTANPNDPLPIKRIKIPEKLLPLGNVSYEGVSEDYKPKEINTPRNVGTVQDAGKGHS